MTRRKDKELLQQDGKFAAWVVELFEDEVVIGTVYEIRKGDHVISECEDERAALQELSLQAALELQNRPTGSGM